MLNIKPALITSLGIILLFGAVFAEPVNMEIQNVDITAGTLDIFMTNDEGCEYFEGVNKIFDKTMEQPDCTTVGGTWIDGNVGGFQVELTGVTITDAIGGTSEDVGFMVSNSSTKVLGFSLTDDPIPAGAGVLTQVSFSDYQGNTICFLRGADETGDGIPDNIVISDSDGEALWSEWNDCWCGSELFVGDLYLDCSDLCGGDTTQEYCDSCTSGVFDCLGECNGAAEEDVCGTCLGEIEDQANCEMAISQIGSNFPEEFSIAQNYPNPFNPVTSITFDVAKMDEISLVVFDLSGREIITLASGTFTPGSYRVNWRAVNNVGDAITSGMYIYRYISSDKAITRKMLYLK